MRKEILWVGSIAKVDTILHIADIHIRNLKRHEEYRNVFQKVYDVCRKKVEENKNTIIYLAGDIVHAKTDMTPELVDLVTEFLDTLSRIAPTILIAGNHDCNLNNMSRMDALSPIVSLINDDFNNLFYLKETLSHRVRCFLKTKNINKKNKTLEIVGCSPLELKLHLEKQFKDGMTWENRNMWHIDHIIPLSSATNEDEIYRLCHYSNLQPLWIEENLKKGNKIITDD